MTAREDYDRRLTELLGQRLTRVRYNELGFGETPEPVPRWAWYSDHDSLDFGVELSFESGLVRTLEWCNAFDWFTVSLWDGPFGGGSENPRYDVSRGSRWEPLVGTRIVRVETAGFEARLSEAGTITREVLGASPSGGEWPPFVVALTFERPPKVWIATYEQLETGERGSMCADHISVFFDGAAARKWGVLPYANLE